MYRLFKFRVTTYCQGTADRGIDYILIRCDTTDTIQDSIDTIMYKKDSMDYKIDIDSFECITIND